MAYRTSKKAREQFRRLREAKAAKRLAGEPPAYPARLPNLRRRITIEDFDFGYKTHVIDLYRCGRIDQYRAIADGKPWKDRIGWAKVCEGIRKSFVRVLSPRSV